MKKFLVISVSHNEIDTIDFADSLEEAQTIFFQRLFAIVGDQEYSPDEVNKLVENGFQGVRIINMDTEKNEWNTIELK